MRLPEVSLRVQRRITYVLLAIGIIVGIWRDAVGPDTRAGYGHVLDGIRARGVMVVLTRNAPTTYYNPGTPDNGWTPDYSDKNIDIGDWVQGAPGNISDEDVCAWLDWHIAHKTPMVIPLYDMALGKGDEAYYRVSAFAAFELQSYNLGGQEKSMTGKFLRWVSNGDWPY